MGSRQVGFAADNSATGSPAAPNNTPVATVILPGTEDPSEMLKRGGLELTWQSGGRSTTVKKFREQAMPHVVHADLALPTLYLHFLDERFRPSLSDQRFNNALRSGNDNSEVQIILPSMYVNGESFGLRGDLGKSLATALNFVRSQGEVEVSHFKPTAGAFTPKTNYRGAADPQRVYLSLPTARPKAPITLDKSLFGIPSNADLYLFAQNHASVAYMTKEEEEAFQTCIAELPEESSDDLRKLAVFFKVFCEGGFTYVYKESDGGRGYLPRNVGIAALGVVPFFPGQVGIGTGYPYLLESRFFRFTDTVPVTISGISSMSERHGRYGLCFTRICYVWEDEAFAREGALRFCCLTPNGGFFYVPSRPSDFSKLGGLVYAFGETKEELNVPMSVQAEAEQAAAIGHWDQTSIAPVAVPDYRVCVICQSETAVMATVPCGHRAYCSACGPQAQARQNTCPVCRQRVTSILRVY
jgi:hypothetical protein